jgi:hypothetical protein
MALKHQSTMVHNSIMLQKNKSIIKQLCTEGKTLEEISKITGVQAWIIQKYLRGIIVKHYGKLDLGYKDVPYYESEEEMFNRKEYDFNSLSDGEKEIYIEREKAGELGKYFASAHGLHGRR